jgi:hypothetical protein
MFSNKFVPCFATRGKSLTKDQLDNSTSVDEVLHTDFIASYNDTSVAAYGMPAHRLLPTPALPDPSVFQIIPNTMWKRSQEKFKLLASEYENSLRMWTKLGTHCDYEDLNNIDPDPTTCTSPCMIYMHYYMRAHPELLAGCLGCLPPDAVSQSNVRGSNIHRVAMTQKKGGRRGSGSGGKKVGSDNACCALDSITSRNNAKEQHVVMESERGLRGDIYAETEKKRKLRDALEAHCGSKTPANKRINKVKAQKMNVNIKEEDDISIDGPDSQESRILELLEREETLHDLKQLHITAKNKLRKYVSSGKEN